MRFLIAILEELRDLKNYNLGNMKFDMVEDFRITQTALLVIWREIDGSINPKIYYTENIHDMALLRHKLRLIVDIIAGE